MAVYVIGDLHLSFGTDKPMDIFGAGWENHIERIKEGFSAVAENDTVVLAGDISWGISLNEALEDFRFIDCLPGKKLIVKGNHDYWWETVGKTTRFFREHGISSIGFLHNNSVLADGIALCGTRGWFYEEDRGEHSEKIYRRELGRLEASLKAGQTHGAKQLVAVLHYPPLCTGFECTEITEMLSEYNVSHCYYGHLHGPSHQYAFTGTHKGVQYHLISGDFVGFCPALIGENESFC
ncbi:MAG: serine/threonine protein phosphatase [Ruminococcaceae bacterium]|nr:serine/threonine protein phosphatase [Oscillospiraceae bacterium]